LEVEGSSSLEETPTRWLAKEVGWFLVAMLVLLVVIKVGLPLIFGVESPLTVVTSSSMEPTYKKGDLLIVVKADPKNLKVGDVIVFNAPWSSKPVVHRIVRIENRSGVIRFYTKGDNNMVQDPGYRTPKDLYGVVVLHIPFVGQILDFTKTFVGRAVIISLIAFAFIYDYIKKRLEWESKRYTVKSDQEQDALT